MAVHGGKHAVEASLVATLAQALNTSESRVRGSSQWELVAGYFNDTLKTCPAEKIALLRLDGDMYTSTMDALSQLYPRVSRGGHVIIDDYGTWPGCKAAVGEYLEGVAALRNLKSLLMPVAGDPHRSVYYFRKP
jgi:hypothetical protein